MAATGLLVGSLGHGWYKSLDKALPGTDRNSVIKKIVLDLIIAGPATAWVFFWGMNLTEVRNSEGKIIVDLRNTKCSTLS